MAMQSDNDITENNTSIQGFDDLQDLPDCYHETQCTFIARDPHTIHAYWDIDDETLDTLPDGECVLRVHDLSGDDSNSEQCNDTAVGFDRQNWYVNVDHDATYYGEIGIRTAENEFIPVAESNKVMTPRLAVAERDDVIWMDPAEGPYVEAAKNDEIPEEPVAEDQAAVETEPPETVAEAAPEEMVEAVSENTANKAPRLPKVENALPPDIATTIPDDILNTGNMLEGIPAEHLLPKRDHLTSQLDKQSLIDSCQLDHPVEAVAGGKPADQIENTIKQILASSKQPSLVTADIATGQSKATSASQTVKVSLSNDDIRSYYMPESMLMDKTVPAGTVYSHRTPMTDIITTKTGGRYIMKRVDRQPSLTRYQYVTIGASERMMAEQFIGASEEFLGSSDIHLPKNDFFLEIDTQLIVTGRTEPDANVRLGNQKIDLNDDGTFTLKLALPDGQIPLEFVAEANDKIRHRVAATLVERRNTRCI